MADNQNNNHLDTQAIVQQFSVTIIPKTEKEYGDQSPSHECYSGENCALNIKCDPQILVFKQEIEEEGATTGKEESHGQTAADSVSHQMQLHPSMASFKFVNHKHPTQGDCPKVEGAFDTTTNIDPGCVVEGTTDTTTNIDPGCVVEGTTDTTTNRGPGCVVETTTYAYLNIDPGHVVEGTTYSTPNIDPGCVPNVKTGEVKRKAGDGSSVVWRASSSQTVHATSTRKVGMRYMITPHSNKTFLYVVKTKGPEKMPPIQVQKRKRRKNPVSSSTLTTNFKKSSLKKQARDFAPTKKISKLSSNCSLSRYSTQLEPRRLRRWTLPNNHTEDSKNCHRCVECTLNMETRYHFRKYRKCSECRYSTSCGAAFTHHLREFHSARETRQETSRKRERKLKFYCLCVCGFVSSYGNRTANHLLKCPEKSCYCTPDAEIVSSVNACEDLERSPGGLLIGEPVKKKEEDWNELCWNTSITSAPSPVAESVVIDEAVQTFRKSPVQIEANSLVSRRCSRAMRRKKKQRWDTSTEISNEKMKLQITDTFDIVTTRQELAPPTKKLMQLKERGSVETLFMLPGRASNSKTATKLFLKNSKTLREDEENPS